MPALPTESDLTGTGRTNAEMRVTHGQLRAFLAGLLGTTGNPPEALASLGVAGQSGILIRAAATTLTAGDRGRFIGATGTWTLTLPTAASAGVGWAVLLRNTGSGTITIARAGSDLIDGVSSAILVPGQAALIISTGASWGTVRMDASIVASSIPFVVAGAIRAVIGAGGFQVDVPITGLAVTQSSTDATAGRVSRAGDYGWGVLDSAPANIGSWTRTDAPSGVYVFGVTTLNQEAMPPGFASGNFGVVRVERFNATFFKQTVSRIAAANPEELWERRWSNGTWSAWTLIYSQANILGALGQTAGVPTGAVLQHGSSANGQFERLANGWQTCLRADLSAANVTTAEGSVFRSADISWTFPAAFLAGSKPVVQVTGEHTALIGASIVALSNTAATVRVKAATAIAGAVTLQASATGRWSDMT